MLERATKVLLDVISEVYCYFYVPLSGEWRAIKRETQRERAKEKKSEWERPSAVSEFTFISVWLTLAISLWVFFSHAPSWICMFSLYRDINHRWRGDGGSGKGYLRSLSVSPFLAAVSGKLYVNWMARNQCWNLHSICKAIEPKDKRKRVNRERLGEREGKGVNDNNIEQVTGNRLQRAACIKHKDNANAAAGHAARKETERCIIKIAFECKCEGGDRRSRRRRRSRTRRRERSRRS